MHTYKFLTVLTLYVFLTSANTVASGTTGHVIQSAGKHAKFTVAQFLDPSGSLPQSTPSLGLSPYQAREFNISLLV